MPRSISARSSASRSPSPRAKSSTAASPAEFCPTVAGGYWLSPALKLRASASRAFRVPSLHRPLLRRPGQPGQSQPAPGARLDLRRRRRLEPRAHAAAPLSPCSNAASATASIITAPRPNAIWQALNIDNLNFTGVESSSAALSTLADLDFRYAWLQGDENTIPIGETKYTFNYPVHPSSPAGRHALPAGLLFRTRLGVLDRLARPPTPLWDVYAARSRGTVHPFLQVTNVTGTSYQEILGVQMPGRSIIGGVELALKK